MMRTGEGKVVDLAIVEHEEIEAGDITPAAAGIDEINESGDDATDTAGAAVPAETVDPAESVQTNEQ